MKACQLHTVSRAWCYDHYVSKLTLCDLGLYHMYTSICVLMYLYYIYLLISAMMDLLSDEVPPIFYERLHAGFWARLVIGLRTVWVAGCGLARKRSARWTLWPCTRTMVSSGFTRSTCPFKLPHAWADQSSLNSNCIWLNHIFNFGILIRLTTYLPTSQHHALSVLGIKPGVFNQCSLCQNSAKTCQNQTSWQNQITIVNQLKIWYNGIHLPFCSKIL